MPRWLPGVVLVLALVVPGCGAELPPYEGTYDTTVDTTTPAGVTQFQGTFSVTNGNVSDPGNTLVGTIAADGAFTGTTKVCTSCNPMPICGRFASTTQAFALTTCYGAGCDNANRCGCCAGQAVRQTIAASKRP